MEQKHKSWYGVKLLYECKISGTPDPDSTLVQATSFEEAYERVEQIGKEDEIDYLIKR